MIVRPTAKNTRDDVSQMTTDEMLELLAEYARTDDSLVEVAGKSISDLERTKRMHEEARTIAIQLIINHEPDPHEDPMTELVVDVKVPSKT